MCVYDIKLTNIGNIEINKSTISGRRMNSYELNKKTVAKQKGFIFNQIIKPTINFYSNLSNINRQYYSKLQIAIMHRQFFRVLSQNPENVQTQCNDRRNRFHFACRNWYLYNNPQC